MHIGLKYFGGIDAGYRLRNLIAGGEIFDGRRVCTGNQQKAGEDAGTGCHRSVLAPTRSDGAIGAGHVAGGGLRLLPPDDGPPMFGFQRRGPGARRCAEGIDTTESIAHFHLILP
jgi:hypothetical protein